MHGQTSGVPIGPDTSFIAAEIVLTAVDTVLEKKVGSLRGFRYLDDYELAFQSRAEAEEAQVHFEAALAEFELTINPTKTRILELPQPFDDPWKHTLAVLPIRAGGARTYNDVVGLFSQAAEIGRRYPGALKYALLKTRQASVKPSIWRSYQGIVWSVVSGEPTTMPTALDLLLEKAEKADLAIDLDAASESIEAVIQAHAPVQNASEVAWALWAAMRLGITLSESVTKHLVGMEDDFVALLSLDAENKGTIQKGALDLSNWEALLKQDDVLHGPHWLLAYEGVRQRWLPTALSQVKADPFFSVLRTRRVRFYDPKASGTPFTGPAGPLPGAPVPEDYL